MRLTGREVRIRHRSVTSILLNGCETWSLLADSELKIQAFETKCLQKILPIFYLELNTNDWVRGKISFLEGPQETSASRQETETCMVRACHTPRQPLQNHPLGHLGGWATPRSAEEMPDGQHQRVDISAHTGTANKGRRDWKRISAESSFMSPRRPNWSRD